MSASAFNWLPSVVLVEVYFKKNKTKLAPHRYVKVTFSTSKRVYILTCLTRSEFLVVTRLQLSSYIFWKALSLI